jgi:hypothetical protein
MSYQTLVLLNDVNESQRLEHPNMMKSFERAWVFEEFELLQKYYRLAEGKQELLLVSQNMDWIHAKEWLVHARAANLKPRVIARREEEHHSSRLWWPWGLKEWISWKLITGRRVVMIGFSPQEQRPWLRFCERECVRIIWLDHKNWKYEKAQSHQDDEIVLASDQNHNRALALIWRSGLSCSRPLMLSSKPVHHAWTVPKWQGLWAMMRFRSRWF